MKYWCVLFISIVCLCICNKRGYAASSAPRLVINPPRIVLEDGQRSAVITLVNTGNTAGKYRLSLTPRNMVSTGVITTVDTPTAAMKQAEKMIRIAPRRVHLDAGEQQHVRVFIRKPTDLQAGEYRTHLMFSLLPQSASSSISSEDMQGVNIAIETTLAFTIPVIIRHGHTAANVALSEATLLQQADESALRFAIERTGNQSVYGDIEIFHISPTGERRRIKRMGGVAIYTSIDKRFFTVPLPEITGLRMENAGVIEILYKEKEKAGGKILLSHRMPIRL